MTKGYVFMNANVTDPQEICCLSAAIDEGD
jgi:hypothetical protein